MIVDNNYRALARIVAITIYYYMPIFHYRLQYFYTQPTTTNNSDSLRAATPIRLSIRSRCNNNNKHWRIGFYKLLCLGCSCTRTHTHTDTFRNRDTITIYRMPYQTVAIKFVELRWCTDEFRCELTQANTYILNVLYDFKRIVLYPSCEPLWATDIDYIVIDAVD